jgi:hypothetical protein
VSYSDLYKLKYYLSSLVGFSRVMKTDHFGRAFSSIMIQSQVLKEAKQYCGYHRCIRMAPLPDCTYSEYQGITQAVQVFDYAI